MIKMNDVSYAYNHHKKVLDKINYEFEAAKVYAIVGKSGAGKTTLLSLLAGLTSPSFGTITYKDQDIQSIDRYQYRRQYVGVIFQQFNLLPHLTAIENIELSMRASGKKISDKRKQAYQLLEKVGLDQDHAKRKILKLSGGEQQRVAIARALSFNPDLILADEPTGNLDQETQNEIMDIFRSLADEGRCVIIVTHSPELKKKADIVYELAPLKKQG